MDGDGATLLQMLDCAAEQLARGAHTLDSLNVFPVPDGDTGTNMLSTVRAALAEGRLPSTPVSASVPPSAPASAGAVAAALARGAMQGARGNSGILLAQFFAGLAAALEGRHTFTAETLTDAFTRAESLARGAVSDPREGTILTVLTDVRLALEGLPAARRRSLLAVLETAAAAAAASVERSPSLLPVLKEAGVVDAGAVGMLLVLQGWLLALGDGRAAAALPALPVAAPRRPRQPESFGFCTEFLLTGADLPLALIRGRLESEGTSVILAGDGREVRVHVHTPSPDGIVAYARSLGTVSRLEVQDMDRQHSQWALPGGSAREKGTLVVALVEGEGVAAVARGLGARAVCLGQGGIEIPPAGSLIVVPSSPSARAAALALRAPAGAALRVIPCQAIPQAVAAIVGFRDGAGLEENTGAMAAAAEGVRSVEVPVTSADPVGYLLGALGQPGTAPAEIVTIYGGRGASPALLEEAASACRRLFPGCTVESVRGGQPGPLLSVSLE